jgi:hypothetical protein
MTVARVLSWFEIFGGILLVLPLSANLLDLRSTTAGALDSPPSDAPAYVMMGALQELMLPLALLVGGVSLRIPAPWGWLGHWR